MRRTRRIALFPFLLLLASFGCSERQGWADQALIVGLESNPTSLDPRFATDAVSFRVAQLIL